MYITLKESHNVLGMIVLFALFLIVLFLLVSFLRKRPFGKSSKIVSLMGLVLAHLQLTFGVILYFLSPLGMNNFSADSMTHTISRFYMVEHPIGMILAGLLITLGYRACKKENLNSQSIYKRVLIYYTLGIVIISYLIPWFLWN